MHLTIKLLTNKHPTFIARTVFVKNNNVDDACRLVNRILGKEGILEQYRLTRYYEKPFQVLAKEVRYLPWMLRADIKIKKHPNFNREDGFSVPPVWDPVFPLMKNPKPT